jgi:hypothetical protein
MLYQMDPMDPLFVTESTFEKVVAPGVPVVDANCDLITHVRNPGTEAVAVRVDVGLSTMVAYILEPGVQRPFVDDGPLPVFAVKNGVRVIVSGDVVLTCALCDHDSTTATEFKIGNWLYKDGLVESLPDSESESRNLAIPKPIAIAL